MDELRISWDNYFSHIHNLQSQIEQSKVGFNSIVAVGRGGFIVGVYLSHQLNLPMFSVMCKSYDDYRNKQNVLKSSDVIGFGGMGNNVLVVDDLIDTGRTLPAVINRITEYEEDLHTNVKLAVIVVKKNNNIIPDYWVIKDDRWIIFPYEKGK